MAKIRTPVVALVALTVGAAAVAGWLAFRPGDDPPMPPPHRSPTAAAEPDPPTYELALDLRRVGGKSPRGRVGTNRLMAPARDVRDALQELYSIGFVDPDAWQDADASELLAVFAGAARERAGRNLEALSLGDAARAFDAVRPDVARVDIRLLLDRAKRPAAAFARVEFEGTAFAADAELPVRHRGHYALRRFGGRWRIVAYDVHGRVPSAEDVRTASFAPEVPSKDVLFVLVIGSDARPGQPVGRTRADSLHIVGVNPRLGRASIVGIPRDSFVPIPGYGTDKINAALARGGPRLVVQTVERLAGIGIDAYLLTGFEGFRRVVNSIGGLTVNVPYRMADRSSHAFFKPGKTRLNGRRALAFSRNRHDAPGGDFGRSLNQGRVLVAALQEFQRELRRDPSSLVTWAAAAARFVDTDLSFGEIVELLLSAASIDADRVRNRVVSGSGGTVGGRSVVILGQKARAVFRDLARDGVLSG